MQRRVERLGSRHGDRRDYDDGRRGIQPGPPCGEDADLGQDDRVGHRCMDSQVQEGALGGQVILLGGMNISANPVVAVMPTSTPIGIVTPGKSTAVRWTSGARK